MKCVNCATEVTAKYCPECGQPSGVQRISFRQVFDDVQAKFLGVDNLFTRTVVDATIRPGMLFSAVLAGNRRRYIGAGGYLFLMLSLMILLFDLFEVDAKAFFGYSANIQAANVESSAKQQAFTDGIMSFISEYIRLISFLMLPIFAIFSRYIFRKSGLNFFEHISLFCYTQAHPLWLTILAGLLFEASQINISGYLVFISIGYSIWFFMDYFKSYTPWRRFFKAVLVQIYAFIALGLIGMIAAIIYVLTTTS